MNEIQQLAHESAEARRAALRKLQQAIDRDDTEIPSRSKLIECFTAVTHYDVSLPHPKVPQHVKHLYGIRQRVLRYMLDRLAFGVETRPGRLAEMVDIANSYLDLILSNPSRVNGEVLQCFEDAKAHARQSLHILNETVSIISDEATKGRNPQELMNALGALPHVLSKIDQYPHGHTNFVAWVLVLAANADPDHIRRKPERLFPDGRNSDEASFPEPRDRRTPQPEELVIEKEFEQMRFEPFPHIDWEQIQSWAKPNPKIAVVILIGSGYFCKLLPRENDDAFTTMIRNTQRDEFEQWLFELGLPASDLPAFWMNLGDEPITAERLRILVDYTTHHRDPVEREKLFRKDFNTVRQTYYRKFSGTHLSNRQVSFGKYHKVVELESFWKFNHSGVWSEEHRDLVCVPDGLAKLVSPWSIPVWQFGSQADWRELCRGQPLGSNPPWLETLKTDMQLAEMERDDISLVPNWVRLNLDNPRFSTAAERVRLCMLAHGISGNLDDCLKDVGRAFFADTERYGSLIRLRSMS